MAAAARCVIRRAEPLLHTAAAHRRRRCPPLALPLSETHCGLLEKAVALRYGDLDNSAVIKAIQEASE
jgi:hypothetical protein